MKKTLQFLFIALALTSCTSKKSHLPAIKDVAYFEWQNADYWVLEYDSAAVTKTYLYDYVKDHTSSKKTSWVFVYKNTEDNSVFTKEKFDLEDFKATILKYKPSYSLYRMMPADTTIRDDAYEVLKMTQEKQ